MTAAERILLFSVLRLLNYALGVENVQSIHTKSTKADYFWQLLTYEIDVQ